MKGGKKILTAIAVCVLFCLVCVILTACRGTETQESAVDKSDNVKDAEISESDKEKKTMKIKVGDKSLTVELVNNSSVDALIELLQKGDITVSVDDYGNFEKVGSLGVNLPQNNEKITTSPGDVILYQGNSITFYYDKNSWNFTRLGRIPDMTREKMLEFFGPGRVNVILSLG